MIDNQNLEKKKQIGGGERSRKLTPKATINLEALKTSIKTVPSLFYSSWKMVTEGSGGINNSRWRPRGQTNPFPRGGWSLKPAPSTSWEAGQNHTARLTRDDEEQGSRASAVTTPWINNAKVGHMQPHTSCPLFPRPPPPPPWHCCCTSFKVCIGPSVPGLVESVSTLTLSARVGLAVGDPFDK